MLCKACQDIFRRNYPEGVDLDHHILLNDLEKAVSDGCYICESILEQIVWERRQIDGLKNADNISQTMKANSQRKVLLKYGLSDASSSKRARGAFSLEFSFFVDYGRYPGRGSCRFLVYPWSAKINKDSPDSPMALARKWKNLCHHGHKECNSYETQRERLKVPERLLKLDLSNQDMVRLWHRNSLEDIHKPQYMTLSHCWGNATFLTLTMSTIEQLMEGVLISSLPRTFQDAIWVARQMESKYLWIDSLCILQDSISDWKHQSSLMADIYQGSLCNIAATSATNAHSSCFSDKSRQLVRPCVVETSWRENRMERGGDRRNDKYRVDIDFDWHKAFQNDQLRERGWVIQELLLAPRILHLGKRQIYWECYELSCCEEDPDEIFSHDTNVGKVHIQEMTRTSLWGSSVVDPAQSWDSLLRSYTSCKLTKPKDKLIALSGIVKIVQQTFQDEYLAGLWRQDLILQLLWTTPDYIANNHLPLVAAIEYRAPSWSWACVDGIINLQSRGPGETAIVLEAYTNPASGDPTGQVTDGLVRLAGPLLTVELEREAGPVSNFLCVFQNRKGIPQICAEVVFASSLLPPKNMHYLIIMNNTWGFVKYYGLLLVPTGSQRGQFYRWGTLNLKADILKNYKHHDWLEYEEFDGDKKYTVSII